LSELCLKRVEHHSAYFQKDRDTLEKRSGRWLKELARQSQTSFWWIKT
jgi:hypothetical protein